MTEQVQHRDDARRNNRPFFKRIRGVIHNEDGVSAVEFALLAPMLVFALLAMVDLGFAISERMTIGHILRAGAQSATENVGTTAIDRILRTTAADMMAVAEPGTTGDDTSLALSVQLICTCATQPGVGVACTTTCAGDQPTQIFYALSGTKTYAGLILPRFSQSKSLQVQVR
ncbi:MULTISPECIES: TadE/TadG family type IV pilus assembly protein [unclassified Yoonia]|uniref:TadE/TadG family type IV pilus assembly protein n=1 Tax=unclassified Yoonia TaxID=2629118 RepID=UPI002AFE0FF3|nr:MULTISPECIES: TadE/TadG family type IV pilus assembly protein [unclassified Yoonia]